MEPDITTRAPRTYDAMPDADRGLSVRIWGARGSLPASGEAFARHGGETCAVEVALGGRTMVLDAGSGLVPMGTSLRERGVREIDLYLTHLHYDHVMGLPFFAPLFDPHTVLRIHVGAGAADEDDAGAHERLAAYFRQPFFPVALDCFPAQVSVHAVRAAGYHSPSALEHHLDADTTLSAAPLHHPGGATGYRVERDGASFAYLTDFEHDGAAGDEAVVSLAHNADLALLDATYAPDEYEGCRGWGHADWHAAGTLAMRAGARSWGLFHHRHDRTDDEIDAIAAAARTEFGNVFASRSGQSFQLGVSPAASGGHVRHLA